VPFRQNVEEKKRGKGSEEFPHQLFSPLFFFFFYENLEKEHQQRGGKRTREGGLRAPWMIFICRWVKKS
jgi:hypothetical protein